MLVKDVDEKSMLVAIFLNVGEEKFKRLLVKHFLHVVFFYKHTEKFSPTFTDHSSSLKPLKSHACNVMIASLITMVQPVNSIANNVNGAYLASQVLAVTSVS